MPMVIRSSAPVVIRSSAPVVAGLSAGRVLDCKAVRLMYPMMTGGCDATWGALAATRQSRSSPEYPLSAVLAVGQSRLHLVANLQRGTTKGIHIGADGQDGTRHARQDRARRAALEQDGDVLSGAPLCANPRSQDGAAQSSQRELGRIECRADDGADDAGGGGIPQSDVGQEPIGDRATLCVRRRLQGLAFRVR